MIIEQDVIDQLEGQSPGRSLTWVFALIREPGRDDAPAVLEGMARAGCISLVDQSGHKLPQWKSAEVFREAADSDSVYVIATTQGLRWAFE